MASVVAYAGIIAVWAISVFVLIGLGALVMTAGGCRRWDRTTLTLAFWQGFAVSLILLQAWHFFARISLASTLLIVVASLPGWVILVRSRSFIDGLRPRSFGPLILIALATIWIANRATGAADQFDSGAYHIPAVQWTVAYPEVPGLGNLHYRMAFSTIYYPFVATFETLGVPHLCTHIANALLLLALLAMQLFAGWGIIVNRVLRPSGAMLFACLPMTIFYCISKDVSNVNTDVPAHCVAIVVGWTVVRLLELRAAGLSVDDETDGRAALLGQALIIGGATLVVLKLSVLVLGFGTAILALWAVPRAARNRHAITNWRASFRTALIVSVVMGLCWTMRSVITSGYLIFPVPFTRLPLAHAVPLQLTRDVLEETSGYPWWFLPQTFVGPLLQNLPIAPMKSLGRQIAEMDASGSFGLRMVSIFGVFATYGFVTCGLPFTAAGLFAIGRHWVKRGSGLRRPTGLLVATIPAALSVIYWFASAPEPRFVAAAAWTIFGFAAAGVAFAWGARHEGEQSRPRGVRLVLVGFVGLAVVAVFAFRVVYLRLNAYYRTLPLSTLVWLPPPPQGALYEPPTVEFETFTTDSGLELKWPVGLIAYWGPIPSTSYRPRALVLTRPGDLSSGFEMHSMPETLTTKFAPQAKKAP